MLPLPPLSDPPSDIPEGGPVMSRRRAGLALLGTALSLTACGQPAEEIVPYVEQPENVVPGVPMRYATALTLNSTSATRASDVAVTAKAAMQQRVPVERGTKGKPWE